MPNKKKKGKLLKKKLLTKNRLVILNEDTFEEIFSLRLTWMNVFIVATLGAIIIIFLTTYIIAFTPLREYIPGYSSSKLKKEAIQLSLKSDSLTKALQENESYISSIRKVLTNEVDYIKQNKDSIKATATTSLEIEAIQPSKAELQLREAVAAEDKYNLFEGAKNKVNIVLFAPLKGKITKNYNPASKHFAVEVAVSKNSPVKTVSNGTVIFASWTPQNANVVIIKHGEGLLSVYKNCQTLQVEQGDIIKTGQIIANAGAYLHFELWKDGYTIDPTQFISFE